MAGNLNEHELKEAFIGKEPIYTTDISAFYRRSEPDIPDTTINWRVYELVKRGILKRIGRGIFQLRDIQNFKPLLYPDNKKLYRLLKDTFPFLDICIWNTKTISQLMLHQPARFMTMVEVEKDATLSVFEVLADLKKDTYHYSVFPTLNKFGGVTKDLIVVNRLITQAPLQDIEGIKTTSLEKILVDLVAEPEIFEAYQGIELQRIYREAAENFTIDYNRLKRYARRWRKETEVMSYLKELPIYESIIKNQR